MFPGGVIIFTFTPLSIQFPVVFPHISGSQLPIAGVASLVLLYFSIYFHHRADSSQLRFLVFRSCNSQLSIPLDFFYDS